MSTQRALVVYDSQFGNTEKIARAMARALSQFGESRAVHVGQMDLSKFREVDLLLIGCPIQGWKPSPGMLPFLERITRESVSGLQVACFDTRVRLPRWLRGNAAEVIAAKFRGLGVEPLLPPEGFLVKGTEGPMREGEMERAVAWAVAAAEKYGASRGDYRIPEPSAMAG